MRHSEGFLVAQAQDARRLNEAPAEEIMVWLELADSCNLEELMPWCGAAVVCNWKVPIHPVSATMTEMCGIAGDVISRR